MPMPMPPVMPLDHRGGAGMMTAAMACRPPVSGDRRGDGAVVTVMAARRHGRSMMMMMDARLDRRGRENQRGPGRHGRERCPDDSCHDSILCRGRDVETTHARNVFNTMGTSPGKSSLIRPGPNASAQAA